MARQIGARRKMYRFIEGFILNKDLGLQNSEKESDSQVQEDNCEEEFLDPNELSSVSSGRYQHIAPSAARQREVLFQDKKEKLNVYGHFPLTDPWWRLKASVKVGFRKSFLQWSSYSLRTDTDQSIISLFLKECDVDDNHIRMFLQWAKTVHFKNLEEKLQRFASRKPNDSEEIARQIFQRINRSDAGKFVQIASDYPLVMEYVSRLLPRRFMNLLKMAERVQGDDTCISRLKPGFLHRLEKMLTNKTEIWKLGFSDITYRELKIVRCEATLKEFIQSDLLSEVPELQQHALKIYNEMKHSCDGHTYVFEDNLVNKVHASNKISKKQILQSLEFLQSNNILKQESNKIFLKYLYDCEKEIAESIQQLAHRPRSYFNTERIVRLVQKEILLDEEQRKAVEMICENPITLISGKGGCGKTTVVSQTLKAEYQSEGKGPGRKPKVLPTAPIGKAANNLKKQTGFDAYTLYQVLWSYALYQKQMAKRRKESEDYQEDFTWRFSEVEVFVVDEGSLASVQIFNSVFKLLMKEAQLRKVIILGDVRQLPSIQPGNALSDMFEGLRKKRWTIELTTNHRSESHLIVRNAIKISEIGIRNLSYSNLEFDAVVTVPAQKDSKVTMQTDDNSFIFIRLPSGNQNTGLEDAIRFLLESAPGLKDDAKSQFITFKNDDCVLINTLCWEHYSKKNSRSGAAPPKTQSNALLRGRNPKLVFEIGNKVCCTKNVDVKEMTNEKEFKMKFTEQETVRLYNGEIFFITEDVEIDGCRLLTFDDKDGRNVCASYRELGDGKLKHAWAKTIHTYQGSECDTVVYVITSVRYQNWQHIYTAVTRGRASVYVVAKESFLGKVIRKMKTKRNTRLKELLEKILDEENLEWNQTSSPQAAEFPTSQDTPKSTQPGTPTQCPSTASGSTTRLQPRNIWGGKQETDLGLGFSSESQDQFLGPWMESEKGHTETNPLTSQSQPSFLNTSDNSVDGNNSDCFNCVGANSGFSYDSKTQRKSNDQHKTPSMHSKSGKKKRPTPSRKVLPRRGTRGIADIRKFGTLSRKFVSSTVTAPESQGGATAESINDESSPIPDPEGAGKRKETHDAVNSSENLESGATSKKKRRMPGMGEDEIE
ncbi:DNA helicase B-like [Acipenser oxyrinchus oxyrinchus]|uniref:DNA helicase B-like n=1 Tax=Acipenser oxyrinchus oxyrinchus TaxID=40147 RepID=A0AAD8DFP9_ACIOX|nr:DNA helicase B-like [Acipenser oxyrinchus oxyrinchus]